jgi:hypothetical protein
VTADPSIKIIRMSEKEESSTIMVFVTSRRLMRGVKIPILVLM